MTILATMREAAARARGPMTDSGAAGAIVGFLLARLCDDGGFSGRSPGSDLYYTVFALMSLEALGADLPAKTGEYLAAFADGEALDLVHLASLARCRAILDGDPTDEAARDGMLARLAGLRCPDGGYSHVPDSDTPTSYGCFLALGAMQDLGAKPRDVDNLAACIERMRSADGAYANVPTARAKGVRPLKLILKYPLRIAINPFISTLGLLLPTLISGEAIVSMVLNLPTTGPLLLQALLTQDMYLAGSFLMLLAVLTVVGMLISDLLLAWSDPRIRYE